MAGNTKILGFTPKGKVQLERWGSKELVEVSKESLTALRKACFDGLPKTPNQGMRDDLVGFKVQYDEKVGLINVGMDPETAEEVAAILLGDVAEHETFSRDMSEEKAWASSLIDAVKAHKDYINTDDEPGVP